MTNHIESYYKGEFKEAIWLVIIAFSSFTLGIIAIAKWGDFGAGILLIFGGYGISYVLKGFWVLLVEQNRTQNKITEFEKKGAPFLKGEKEALEEIIKKDERNKTINMVTFLVGILFVLMGAFGSWSEIALGVGVGLSIQAGISLCIGLLNDYRAAFYMQKLKKNISK